MIAFGTPTGEDIKAVTVMAFEKLVEENPDMLRCMMMGTYVEHNQNLIVEQALLNDCSHVLFIDSDMMFPTSILKALLGRNKDIVGAVYRTRSYPYFLAATHVDGTPADGTETGLREMRHIPSGMMLVKARVFENMGYPWFFNTYGGTPDKFVGNDVNFCLKARQF